MGQRLAVGHRLTVGAIALALHDFFHRLDLQLVVRDARHHQGAAGVHRAIAQAGAGLLAQVQQLDAAIHITAALADLGTHLIGVEVAVLHQGFIALSFFELAQVIALQVFNDLDLQHLVVGQFAHHGRDGLQPCGLAGPVAAFTGHQLVFGPGLYASRVCKAAGGQGAQQQRLMNTAGLDAGREFVQARRVKGLARVGQAGDDQPQGRLGKGGVHWGSFEGGRWPQMNPSASRIKKVSGYMQRFAASIWAWWSGRQSSQKVLGRGTSTPLGCDRQRAHCLGVKQGGQAWVMASPCIAAS